MSDARNKYTTLISNTIIFALGTFGSKLLDISFDAPLYLGAHHSGIRRHGCGRECIQYAAAAGDRLHQ